MKHVKSTYYTPIGAITEEWDSDPARPGVRFSYFVHWERTASERALAERLLQCVPGTTVKP